MTGRIKIETVAAQPVAAVIERVAMGEIGRHVMPNLDRVHAFLEAHPALRLRGAHNVLVYRGKDSHLHKDGRIPVEYAVQVARAFADAGDVNSSSTPEGRVATALHAGPYEHLSQTHTAIQKWCAEHGHALAGIDWEIYGDWNDDPEKLETRVCYLLH